MRRTALTALALIALAGCGRSGAETEESSPAATGATAAAPGDFGDLKGVCGPGDAHGATARGVTDDTIRLGTMADPGNPFAPGLNKEFFVTAKAFEAWCNAAGGINGRKLDISLRDSKLFDVAARVIDACQSDFMLVGGGNPVDDVAVKPRLKCGLATIPAFETSPEAINAPLQVAPTTAATDLQVVGPYRLLAAKYPEAIEHYGVGSPDVPALISTTTQQVAGAATQGFRLVDFQKTPAQVDDWRPYVQRSQKAGVQMLSPSATGLLMQPYVQAMNDIGYAPAAMTLQPYYYVPQTAEAAKVTQFPPAWVGLSVWPLELADQNPATREAIDLIKASDPDAEITLANLNSLNAFLLWAKSATSCGSDLTAACVLEKAGGWNDWTAGGLFAPVNTDPTRKKPSDCVVMLRVTPQGFTYDRAMTQSNDRIYNCDPRNVVRVK